MFSFWREADTAAKRALIAASLGWMLDSFDVMLYALVAASIIQDLNLDPATAGWIASVTLIAAAAGGIVFGVLADRLGRTRALMLSVLLYSVFTAACGFAQSALQLAVFRIFLGIGMGGEWASGAALVSETWPDKRRGKALGFMQSSWAIGYALAAVVVNIVQSMLQLGWRAVFFVGVLPALFALWVRRSVEEPAIWQRSRTEVDARRPSIREAIRGPMLRITVGAHAHERLLPVRVVGIQLVGSGVPLAARRPGRRRLLCGDDDVTGVRQSGRHVVRLRHVRLHQRRYRPQAHVHRLSHPRGAVDLGVHVDQQTWLLLILGPVTSFFATGYFSGFGAVTAELYPTAIRATAQGFTYNIGRVASAAAPWLVGGFAKTHGYPAALSIAATSFLLAAVFWIFIPETKGRKIQ